MLAAKRGILPLVGSKVLFQLIVGECHGAPVWLLKASPIALELYHGPGTAVNGVTCWKTPSKVTAALANVALCEDDDELFDQRPKKADSLPLHHVFDTLELSVLLLYLMDRDGAAASILVRSLYPASQFG